MIELILPCAIAVILLLILFFATSGNSLTDESFLEEECEGRASHSKAACPSELVDRLFSREDWQFVAKLGSDPLLRIFRKERKAVASLWVRQISWEISRTMQEHTNAARHSVDLKVGIELRLFCRFSALRMLCGLLVVLIRFVDLHALSNIAARAGKLAENFRAGPELNAPVTPTRPTTYHTM